MNQSSLPCCLLRELWEESQGSREVQGMLQGDGLCLWEPSTQLSLEPEGGLGPVAQGMKSMCYPYTLLLNLMEKDLP